jgi:uncharacterized membrane protein YeiB
VAPDVTRTLALLGVIVMNYHGFLNARMLGDGFWDRLFHPFDGVLSTRFAATFVLMAGIGVALMASNALRAEDRIGLGSMRSRLARRGLLLYAAGLALNHAWGGTILFYYGAYLIIAAVIVGLSDRALVVLATGTIIATGGLNAWLSSRPSDWSASNGSTPERSTPSRISSAVLSRATRTPCCPGSRSSSPGSSSVDTWNASNDTPDRSP